MAVEWTGLGPELLLVLDRARPEPLGEQLRHAVRDAIRAGRLGPGERLPSTRALAGELRLSRGLVVDCYAQLEAEGYLVTRTGSATRVAERAAPTPADTARTRPDPDPAPAVDFRPVLPDLGHFPRRDWLWAHAEACRTALDEDLGYGDAAGSEDLRTVLAAYLRRVRGADAHADRMVVCSGASQALGLLLGVLAAAGVDRVAVEEPGSGYRDPVSARAGVAPVPVPVDADGIDVDALEASGVRAVLVTPAHQSPTGVVLTPERRHSLVAWARRRQAIIIEDDYDAELRYDREPVGTVQGLAPDRVVLLGTVSKSLAPGLRLGWLVAPDELVTDLVEAKRSADRGCPRLDQLTLAGLIRSGRYDRHLRRMRRLYGTRHETVRRTLAAHAPNLTLTGLPAGMHAVLALPPAITEAEIVAAAAARSVGVHGLEHYRLRPDPDAAPGLVLGFGHLDATAIEHGVRELAWTITHRSQSRRRPSAENA